MRLLKSIWDKQTTYFSHTLRFFFFNSKVKGVILSNNVCCCTHTKDKNKIKQDLETFMHNEPVALINFIKSSVCFQCYDIFMHFYVCSTGTCLFCMQSVVISLKIISEVNVRGIQVIRKIFSTVTISCLIFAYFLCLVNL